MADELKKFFTNTLDRHGRNCLENVVDSTLASGVNVPEYLSYSSKAETFSEQKNFLELAGCFKIQGIEVASGLRNKPKYVCSLDGDDKKPGASGIVDTRSENDSSGCFPASRCLKTLVPVRSHLAPHSCIFGSQSRNGKTDNCGPCEETLAEYSATDNKMSFSSPLEHVEKHLVTNDLAYSCTNMTDMALIDSTVLSGVTNVPNNMNHIEKDNAGIFGSSEVVNVLLDLGGDYDSHFRNLHYGQLCHVYARSGLAFPGPPLSPLVQKQNLWEPVLMSTQFLESVSPRSRNGVALRPHSFAANNFSFKEENRKPRGTGTYFPNLVLKFSIED